MFRFLRTVIILTLNLTFLYCISQDAKLVLPIGHTEMITFTEFSPDARKILTVSRDNIIKVWDSETGALLLDLKGHFSTISSAQFSPDGKKILSASYDRTAKVWDAETGQIQLDLKLHKEGVTSAEYNSDGTRIVTASLDKSAIIWNSTSGLPIQWLNAPSRNDTLKWNIWEKAPFAHFSPNNLMVVTNLNDSTVKVWQPETGQLILNIPFPRRFIKTASFAPNSQSILIVHQGQDFKTGMTEVWNIQNKSASLVLNSPWVGLSKFTHDGKKVISSSSSKVEILDIFSGDTKTLTLGKGNYFTSRFEISSDSKTIMTYTLDNLARLWDINSGRLKHILKGHTNTVNCGAFSYNDKYVATGSADHTVKIWNTNFGSLWTDIRGHSTRVISARFSPDGTKIVTVSTDSITRIWDSQTCIPVNQLKGHTQRITGAKFNLDGNRIVTYAADSTARIWDAIDGKPLLTIRNRTGSISSIEFSPDGQRIVAASNDLTAKVWNALSGKLLFILKGHTDFVNSASFSKNGKYILTASRDNTAKVWDGVTGMHIYDINYHEKNLVSANFTNDDKFIATRARDTVQFWNIQDGSFYSKRKEVSGNVKYSPDGKKGVIIYPGMFSARVWNTVTNKWLFELRGHNDFVIDAEFSPDGNRILTASFDNTVKLWDAATGKLVYTFFSIDKSDYLVVDNDFRYDGTPAARKFLYFTCGSEVIDLEQVKESLWVPSLAERINKGEIINDAKLKDLSICGLMPQITSRGSEQDGYSFTIKSGHGGLGKTTLLINGNPTKDYETENLKKIPEGYELRVDKKELEPYLIKGIPNPITVKAYTSENSIYSKATHVALDDTGHIAVTPNLYCVIIGVSKYKDTSLKLNYAAKDAVDIGKAIAMTSRKLLGKDNVFIYNFNTGDTRYAYPDKRNIQLIFDSISGRAKANDILLIFFAGHGIVQGEAKKQFYFLTSDATSFNNFASTAISTAELIDWIKPEKIKAQKRILILDACNSGQAINDIAQLKDFVSVRNNDIAEERREIERLNDQAGMYILSASASNQKAYEMGIFQQGLLTYSLLKAVKQRPDILEDNRYLNLSRWFDAARRGVSDFMNQFGTKGMQEPQVISNTSFNIGIVDQEVVDQIFIEAEKPIFSKCEFRNSSTRIDDLNLRTTIDQICRQPLTGDKLTKVFFQQEYNGSDGYIISGDYKISGSEVVVTFDLIKGGKIFINKSPWKVKGTIDNKKYIAEQIVKRCLEGLLSKKLY